MIVTYHEIGPEPNTYIYSTTCGIVREHLNYLRTVTTFEANTGITFDDGHVSHHRYAAPLLEEFGFRGIFFVTAGWIGVREGFMNWNEVEELARRGHVVQSHGWSHALLTQCDDSALQAELSLSKATLEDRLGSAITSISMPGGRWNSRVLRACAAAGYRHVFHSNPFHSNANEYGIALSGRVMLRRTTTVKSLREISAAEHQPLSALRVRHGLKTGLRTILGDRLYQTAWEVLGSAGSRRKLNDVSAEFPRV